MYKTPQALGKVVSRVKPVLPHSQWKRKAVVLKLANSEGITVAKKSVLKEDQTVFLLKQFNLLKAFFF